MQAQNESDSPNNKHTNPLSQLAQNMFSNNTNTAINNSTIMLAAIVSLLLVILFVLLLHVYAKWFLSHSHQSHSQNRPRHHRRRRHHRHVSGIMGPTHFHHHHFHLQDSPFSTKGLDSATVSAIPIFVYETGETEELECVICLCGFEEGEIGRSLPKCGHAFHVECIDMWLSSHSNCPICRAPIVCGNVCENDSHFGSVNSDNDNDNNDDDDDDDYDDGEDDHGVIEIVIGTPSYEISETEVGNENENGGSVSETTSSSLLGCSLKRMLSKVFVSSNNVNEELQGGS